MEISVTIEQLELQCWRTWKECTVKIKNLTNCIARRISHTCLLPHLAKTAAAREIGRIWQSFGGYNHNELLWLGPQIHLDAWHNGNNGMYPLLQAEQETSNHPLHHSEGVLRRASNQRGEIKVVDTSQQALKGTAVDLSEGTAAQVPCPGF